MGAAELYMEGSCCWRCMSPTSLMIRGHCPVFPDQQVMGIMNEVGDMHRQQQEPSLYSSAAPKGACKPHCSHIDRSSRLPRAIANYEPRILIKVSGVLGWTWDVGIVAISLNHLDGAGVASAPEHHGTKTARVSDVHPAST